MNFSGIAYKAIQKADDRIGKVFSKINKKINFTKIPAELSSQLSEAGINVAGKNTRREVIAAINHQVRTNIDNTVKNGLKIAALEPEPDLVETAVDVFCNFASTNMIRNTGLAKAADNSRDLLTFRHENVPVEAQQIIKKYLQNPINVLKAYIE